MVKTVIVIGAGITGVSTAEWLRRDGVAVTLIDRVAPGAPEQASYGNAGLLARGAIMPVADTRMFLKAPLLLLDPSFPLYLKWRYLPKLFPWLNLVSARDCPFSCREDSCGDYSLLHATR